MQKTSVHPNTLSIYVFLKGELKECYVEEKN